MESYSTETADIGVEVNPARTASRDLMLCQAEVMDESFSLLFRDYSFLREKDEWPCLLEMWFRDRQGRAPGPLQYHSFFDAYVLDNAFVQLGETMLSLLSGLADQLTGVAYSRVIYY